jgi:hypothetical protein
MLTTGLQAAAIFAPQFGFPTFTDMHPERCP